MVMPRPLPSKSQFLSYTSLQTSQDHLLIVVRIRSGGVCYRLKRAEPLNGIAPAANKSICAGANALPYESMARAHRQNQVVKRLMKLRTKWSVREKRSARESQSCPTNNKISV